MSRTLERVRGSGFRGGGMVRLGSMVAMLLVVWMLMERAREPGMWRWLEERGQESGVGGQGEEFKVQGSKFKVEEAEDSGQLAVGSGGKEGERGQGTGDRGQRLTDESVVEWLAAKEQFQAVSDGTVKMGREEMPAYWRLFRWAKNQTLEQMAGRAEANVVLNQFVQWPEEQRGKLFKIDLNVRRVLSFPASENSAGVETVYEVWGFTLESQAWLYVVLTAELPPGMPMGPKVDERATFAGYFLKTQGYHAAGAGPKDKALVAPLLIGKLARVETGPPVAARAEGSWMNWVVTILALAGASGVLVWFARRRDGFLRGKAQAPRLQAQKTVELKGWLANAERGELKKEGAGGGDGVF